MNYVTIYDTVRKVGDLTCFILYNLHTGIAHTVDGVIICIRNMVSKLLGAFEFLKFI